MGVSLLPSFAVLLLQSQRLDIILTLTVVLLAVLFVYGVRTLDLFLQQQITTLTFDFRFDYVPIFSERIFGWQQNLIDSVKGKTVIDQAYEAIYNGATTGIGMVIDQTIILIRTGCQIIVLLIMMGTLSFWPVAIVVALNLFQYTFQRINNQWYFDHKERQNQITSYQNYFVRTLMKRSTGKDIRLFAMFKVFHQHFDTLIRELVEWQRNYSNAALLVNVGQRLVNVIGLALSLLIMLVVKKISIARLLFFITAIQTLNLNFANFRNAYASVGKNLVFVDNFRKFMAFPYQEHSVKRNDKFNGSGQIHAQDIGYTVNGIVILHDINFSVKQGEMAAIVGENGAGKSTLIKLLCGLYLPTSGSVHIDGQKISDWTPQAIHKRLAVQFQDDVMLHFTTAENIACTIPQQIDEQKIKTVLDEVGLGTFVATLPNGAQTFIGNELAEKGIQLSGEQKEKLLFARVLYRDADFNILDEPTAALDPISESDFYDLVDKKMSHKTTMIVAHRLGALAARKVKIFVMKNGTVIASGSHRSLLDNCDYYQELWEAQKSMYVGSDDHEAR